MSALLTSSKKVLFIPEDKSCAILYVPPVNGQSEGGAFCDARLAGLPEDETATPLSQEKATSFLRAQIDVLAQAWGDPPSPSATQDELIKWVNACLKM